MPETERQKMERLLRAQLGRIQQAEAAESQAYRAARLGASGIRAAFAGRWSRWLSSRPWRGVGRSAFARLRPDLPRLESIRAAARLLPGRWRARKGKDGRLTGHRDGIAAMRGERAAAELFAAAESRTHGKPPGASRFTAPAAGPLGRSADGNRGLPNVSAAGARLGAMKETPARDWGPPPKVQFPRPDRKKDRRSDLVIAAFGVALGLTCALFPWYIFFNQEQFGVQAIAFGGRGANAGRIVVEPGPGDDIAQVAARMPKNLDLFSTGTLQAKPETADKAPGLDKQPFPAEAADFRLVHVANGRAMIEDDTGLWIVQQGSGLPDSTRVKSIEKHKGQWVLVTSADRIVEISK